ncbi:MAG: hypothetical protein FJ086_15690, partial [Deltaproteobacteria bacterium]|nr:hypothetical protein [Deltaproteobacteria bacterium]
MSPPAALPPAHRTHEVKNQPPHLPAHDAFSGNRPLVEALEREGAGWAKEKCSRLGLIAG